MAEFRVCSKINSDFAGGCLAVWLGASDAHTLHGSVRSEQRRQTAKQPQPSGAGRRLAICFVARRSQPAGGDAPSSRLASGPTALPPKSEVIFERTLKLKRRKRRAPLPTTSGCTAKPAKRLDIISGLKAGVGPATFSAHVPSFFRSKSAGFPAFGHSPPRSRTLHRPCVDRVSFPRVRSRHPGRFCQMGR